MILSEQELERKLAKLTKSERDKLKLEEEKITKRLGRLNRLLVLKNLKKPNADTCKFLLVYFTFNKIYNYFNF